MIGRTAIFFAIVAAIAALAYSLTICPTVEFIDSGELAMACKFLGIAHPTGYPLYTLIGHITAYIPAGELIFRLNLMSLIFTALAAGLLFLVILAILSDDKSDGYWPTIISASTAVFTALTPVWWNQGTTNEVYSLNLILISISILAIVRYLKAADCGDRWLILSGFALGLSLTNHLSAIYMLPGYVTVLAAGLWRKRIGKTALLMVILFFIFPLSLYAVLPIRAAFAPFLNWGGVNDPYFFYKHLSGWQYRIWMFSDLSLGTVAARFADSASLLREQFGWIGLILAAIGLVVVWSRGKLFALFALLIALADLVYASNYQIMDIESYYLPVIIVIALFMAFGLDYIFKIVMNSVPGARLTKLFFAAALIALPLSNFIDNFFEEDRSNATFARQGAVDLVNSMQQGGLAIVENWDFYSPWLYLRYEENYRPDALLIDKELMRRSWYVDFIRRYNSEVYMRSEKEIGEFLRQVEPFERGRPFAPSSIDKAYYDMLDAIMLNESSRRPVYTNVTGDPKFLRGMPFIPEGILFRIYQSPVFLEAPRFRFDDSYWENRFIFKDTRVAVLLSYYERAFNVREKYCRQFGKAVEADYYVNLTAYARSAISRIEK